MEQRQNSMAEEKWKVYKCVEIKQHTLEQSLGQRETQKENQTTLSQIKMKTQYTKIYGIQKKQF